MAKTKTIEQADTETLARLNDLLQLDYDAVQAYTLAMDNLENEQHRDTIRRFRTDHERHIDNLSALIRGRNGTPVELLHIPTGPFKLAIQAVGIAGGDNGILLAFKANERQVRDKYRRVAERPFPDDVKTVLQGNAADEQRHYSWVLETLDELGLGADTPVGKMEQVVELGNEKMADVMESAERKGMAAAHRAGRTVKQQFKEHPVRTALLTVGTGILVANAVRSR
jgi:rubrerythrin